MGEPVDYKNWQANNILDVSKVKVTDTTETNPFASYIRRELNHHKINNDIV